MDDQFQRNYNLNRPLIKREGFTQGKQYAQEWLNQDSVLLAMSALGRILRCWHLQELCKEEKLRSLKTRMLASHEWQKETKGHLGISAWIPRSCSEQALQAMAVKRVQMRIKFSLSLAGNPSRWLRGLKRFLTSMPLGSISSAPLSEMPWGSSTSSHSHADPNNTRPAEGRAQNMLLLCIGSTVQVPTRISPCL